MIPDILPEYRSMSDSEKINILGIGYTDLRTKSDKYEKILITGDPPTLPLPERTRNLERFQDRFEYWARIIGGALLLNFLGVATGILVSVFRFLPVLEKLAKQNP